MKILLIDVSGIVHAAWHIHANDPDPDATSQAVVSRVRSLVNGHDRVALACDVGKSFRADISPDYKVHREAKPAALWHQYAKAVETLEKDGLLALKAPGFEADDIIATAIEWLKNGDETPHVTIATADKDLLQLVGEHVSAFSLTKGVTMGPADVEAAFGVRADQLRDYLALVGDRSDNVRGIQGVGPKTAALLLRRFGTLTKLYAEIDGKTAEELDIKPSILAALNEGIATVDLARRLVTLRTDAPIECAKILEERQQKPLVEEVKHVEFDSEEDGMTQRVGEVVDMDTGEVIGPHVTVPEAVIEPSSSEDRLAVAQLEQSPKASQQMVLAPKSWETALEPQNPSQAVKYATMLFNSRMFNGYGNPDAVLSTVLLGRELGLGMMASLRGVHNIKGKHALSADLMAALVINSGKSKYFTPIKLTDEVCTYKTHRIGNPEPLEMSFSLKEAERAGLVKPDSNWLKYPLDMCKARAIARLARAVYPDICFGLYVPEELADINGGA